MAAPPSLSYPAPNIIVHSSGSGLHRYPYLFGSRQTQRSRAPISWINCESPRLCLKDGLPSTSISSPSLSISGDLGSCSSGCRLTIALTALDFWREQLCRISVISFAIASVSGNLVVVLQRRPPGNPVSALLAQFSPTGFLSIAFGVSISDGPAVADLALSIHVSATSPLISDCSIACVPAKMVVDAHVSNSPGNTDKHSLNVHADIPPLLAVCSYDGLPPNSAVDSHGFADWECTAVPILHSSPPELVPGFEFLSSFSLPNFPFADLPSIHAFAAHVDSSASPWVAGVGSSSDFQRFLLQSLQFPAPLEQTPTADPPDFLLLLMVCPLLLPRRGAYLSVMTLMRLCLHWLILLSLPPRWSIFIVFPPEFADVSGPRCAAPAVFIAHFSFGSQTFWLLQWFWDSLLPARRSTIVVLVLQFFLQGDFWDLLLLCGCYLSQRVFLLLLLLSSTAAARICCWLPDSPIAPVSRAFKLAGPQSGLLVLYFLMICYCSCPISAAVAAHFLW